MAASYWEKRFERLKKHEMRKADAVNADLARAYRDALRKLRADVERWYDRFARENDVSLARAREILDRRELAAFRMALSDYIAEAKRLDLDADHIRALENASMRVRLTRAQEIYLKTAQHVEKLAKRQGLKLDGLMREVYTDATYRTAYETQKLKGFENVREVPARQIDAAVSRPWAPDGADFSARIWKQKKDLINNLQTDITRALMTGETTADLAEQISKRFNTTYGQAYRLVETETAYIQERAMLDTYDALDVEQYEICAVLDSKTSETCQHLDGKIFDKKDAKPGVTMPPFHCHCRTTTIPYIEGVTDDGERVARDPETGKSVRVPDMTYEEWKAKYVVSEIQGEEGTKNEERSIIEIQKAKVPSKAFEDIGQVCTDGKVEYRSVKTLSAPLSTEEIIAKVSGGDESGGSCASVAYAYIGNRGGVDVLDFRGGSSRAVFSNPDIERKISNLPGVLSYVAEHTNDFIAFKKLSVNIKSDKEYYLGIGRHAAIIRKIEGRLEYLELQSPFRGCNGFKPLNSERLRRRFKCQQSHSRKGIGKYEVKSTLIEVESLARNEEFKALLGYINTAPSEQQKGEGGSEK